MGSLAADSISVIEVTVLLIERERNIENTAAASVEDIIAHNNNDLRKGQPEKKQKATAAIIEVSNTPIVAKIMVGFIIGFKLEYLVLYPPANNTNIRAIFANCLASSALSKYINPVTSLPNIIPNDNEIIINGIFNFLEINAEKTININITATINSINISLYYNSF